jgi:hypothetical protein
MTTHHLPGTTDPQRPRFWRSRYGIGLILFGAIALYFLLTEHRAHLLGVLPFVLLLACPLLHLFMHRGHGHGHGRGGDGGSHPTSPQRDGERS